METSELARFGHHPDPAIDFCVEVEEIEAIWIDRCNKFANPDDASLDLRVGRAIAFQVGGDLHAINAKDRLRKIEDSIMEDAIERADRLRAAAPDLYEALSEMVRCWIRENPGCEPPDFHPVRAASAALAKASQQPDTPQVRAEGDDAR